MKEYCKYFLKIVTISCLIPQLSGCFSLSIGHEVFVARYGQYVGESVGSFRAIAAQYGYKPLRQRRLANGNYEIEIDNALPRSRCLIFYQYNPETQTIVNWRYVGGDDFHGCYANPN